MESLKKKNNCRFNCNSTLKIHNYSTKQQPKLGLSCQSKMFILKKMELHICLEAATFRDHAWLSVPPKKKGCFIVDQMCWVLIKVTKPGRT